jgi:hypothetical protein
MDRVWQQQHLENTKLMILLTIQICSTPLKVKMTPFLINLTTFTLFRIITKFMSLAFFLYVKWFTMTMVFPY